MQGFRSVLAVFAAKPPELDSLPEIYHGFSQDREVLKANLVNADEIWRKAFTELRRTPDFYQRSDEDVARETMRVILEWMSGHADT